MKTSLLYTAHSNSLYCRDLSNAAISLIQISLQYRHLLIIDSKQPLICLKSYNCNTADMALENDVNVVEDSTVISSRILRV